MVNVFVIFALKVLRVVPDVKVKSLSVINLLPSLIGIRFNVNAAASAQGKNNPLGPP
jgi:hypothetical protein